MNALQLTSEHASDFVVITVAGELDLATRPYLFAFAQDIIDTSPGTVVVDLSGVTFIDACGLSALIAIRRHAGERGTPLLLAGAPPAVLKLLKLTNLDASFTVVSRSASAGPPPGGAQDAPPLRAGLPFADR
ncbi:STAS domain-containing protein [Streptosporangium sp. NPDC050855]|uniref:STAS domain-containing protein n=1 Tax=Streptosporangium sp. NPDC050855 TaxID=3366194 RepID=UPI0037B22CA6